MIPTNTLSRALRNDERRFPHATGELSELILSIAYGVKVISQLVQTAGFKGLYGYSGKMNVHGDKTQLLDEEADQTLVDILGSSGHFGLLVSEERDSVIATEIGRHDGKYVVAFDPLDGSSNIGSNIPVGTIFCIFRKKDENRPASVEDFLQSGKEIVAAGYSIYGAKTTFVYCCGGEVRGFTLDPTIGEFLLTEPNIRCPERGAIYSTNEGYTSKWSSGITNFVDLLKKKDEKRGTPYTSRYVGSLVVDFDRNLKKGGIFLYPASSSHPKGRLRLLYEVMPLAYIAEHAGGRATDGTQNILDIVPKDIHERSAFITGSTQEVGWFLEVAGA